MTQRKASPAVESRGMEEKRIVLTRSQLVKIIVRLFDEVNTDEKKLPGFLDDLFVEAERAGD